VDQVSDRVELPLSGLGAELTTSSVGLLHWRLVPAGGAGGPGAGVAEAALGEAALGEERVPEPLERSPILGWRFGTRTDARRRQVPYTVAWGSLLGGRGPLRVVVVRDRRLRPAVREELVPFTLSDVFWIAETRGRYDRLVVSDGVIVESRDLIGRPPRPR
jgi:hypothetical protein